MSDVHKIVAAILTAGRVPTMSGDTRSMSDWLAEYNAWLETLANQAGGDKAETKELDEYAESINEQMRK
jgi:hypothetical protein